MDMKAKPQLLIILLLLGSLALPVGAITRYVDLNSASPTPPYTSWSSAATNINDAIDAATTNDLILVTNGIYQDGGRVVTGTMTNRVAITKPVVVSSVNGPAVTIIQGAFDPISNSTGDNAVQGVYLCNNAVLAGFTITNGVTQEEFWGLNQTRGGGIWCESTNAVVTNCIITGNKAFGDGGGVYRGTVINCQLYGNIAGAGGGAASAQLVNCLLYENAAYAGGGAYECTVINSTVTYNILYPSLGSSPRGGGVASCASYNSIIYYNTNADGDVEYANYGWTSQMFTHCCTTPLPPSGLNIDDDPLFVDAPTGDFHLLSSSPCINAGNNSYAPPGSDLDGNLRIVGGLVDMGAFEMPTNLHVPTTIYVDISSTNPIPPYTNWSTAAIILQDAADVSRTGDEILVFPGVYKTGGRLTGLLTNRVVLVQGVRLRSVNGPAMTVIEGYRVPGVPYSDSNVRCAYLGSGATLTGVTLTNGGTRRYDDDGPPLADNSGAGVYCETTSEIVTNCIIINNNANGAAGGICNGTANNSIIFNNSARIGGGALSSVLNNCIVKSNSAALGGGAGSSVWNNCIAIGNFGPYYGGAAHGGILVNCLLINNSAESGGGTYDAVLSNCTVTANEAFTQGGGVGSSVIRNCIVYGNSAPTGSNIFSVDASFCCTSPLPTNSIGNFANAPLFVNSSSRNFRLQTNSPCINTGSNAYSPGSTDLDGRSRIIGGVVDVGAYEFQGAGMGELIGWLQSFALPTDGSADFTDADGDCMNNYNEWRTDTNPTNGLSLLRMVSATNGVGGTLVTWQSVATRSYRLERSTNLGSASPFQTIATNITGAVNAKTFTDASTTNYGAYFYRVGVE